MALAEPKERVIVYLPSPLKQEIHREADYAGQTLSVWVERALTYHLNRKGVHIKTKAPAQ